MANEIYNTSWWGTALDTARTAGTNPDFFGSQMKLLTSEQDNLVTNGDFATDSDWNRIGTWSISSGQASANANSQSQYLQQDFSITNSKVYKFTYEIIENTLNGNGASLSTLGGFGSVPLSNVVGYHTEYITASNQSATYALRIGVSGTATSGKISIDNVSVQLVRCDLEDIEAKKCLADWIHTTALKDLNN